MSSSPAMVRPFQNTEKLPATRPDRMFSDGPPSRDAATISRVWREFELVNTFVSSGMSAAASVPHEMMLDSFHHRPPPRSDSIHLDTMYVTAMERSDVSHTSVVSGASKSILSLPVCCERASVAFSE